MDASTRRNLQIVFIIALVAATARTAWIFYQRHASDKAANSAAGSAPARTLHADDYVYLRPSHAHDLASAKKFLVGKTVWVKAGNAVAYSSYHPGQSFLKCIPVKSTEKECLLPPLAPLDIKNVVMSGDQMLAVFAFAPWIAPPSSPPTDSGTNPQQTSTPPPLHVEEQLDAVPIGRVKNGDANIIMDDLFYYEDPHKLYPHWTKDAWAAIERHEITQGMSEAQATAAMGVGRAPESGAAGEYGNRTLVFTDPAHPDKPVTVTFADNAAVSVTH
jgi:hypothetical protein